MKRFVIGLSAGAVLALILVAIAASQLPAAGAGALLFPSRHLNTRKTPDKCVDREFTTAGITLRGWQCQTTAPARRGMIVYLHGVADNRGSAIGAIDRSLPLGFDVIAYDSRAHGASEGDRCRYGFFEKRDLQAVLDQVSADNVILIGHSLGAALALQAAAIEPRVKAVVAASTFSDLRTIATERATMFPAWSLAPAFARAERDGKFVVDEVSAERAAADIVVPVLLVHGGNDRDTARAHSARVFRALRGPKQMIEVPGAGHNDVLRADVWMQIEQWLSALPS
jgi:pimeloyl-ACP methyl ester carboxylesterase